MIQTILITVAALLAFLVLCGVSSRVNLLAAAVLLVCAALLVGRVV